MPGLVGCVFTAETGARSILEKMVTAIMHQLYHVVYSHSIHGDFACTHHGHFDHSVVASTRDGDVEVLLDGWLFGWRAKARNQFLTKYPTDAVHYCLDAYLEGSINFITDLNGQFNLLILDKRSRSIYLINDRYGMRPLQYMLLNDALYFAPEGKAILAGSGISKKLNIRMIINQLSWGRIWIGQETFFDGILMFPPASILHWKDGRTTIDQYWDYVYKPESNIDDEFIDHTVAIFRRAVARQTQAPLRYGVSLSGGLDSRTVLAALSQTHNGKIRAYSWGVSDKHDEVAIARLAADRLDIPWQYLSLTAADYISQAIRGVFLSEGLDLHVQSFGLKTYPIIRQQTDALLTGLALDLTLGGSYLLPSMITTDNIKTDVALAWVFEKAALFSPDECLQLVRIKEAAAILENLRSEAICIWQTGQNEHPADQCDRFFLRSRVWRYTFLRQVWQRLFLEDIAPTFDNEFIDCLLRIPPVWRVGHRFYQRFLQRLEPRMMDVVYQETMLPPAAPLEFWSRGSQLEQKQEQLFRDIWRETKGQVFVPYRRFSTNYDEWLRRDPDWMAMTNDLILSAKSLSCDRFLNRQIVANLIEDHRIGKAANHRKILQLMTLELFLRQFFD